MVIVCRKYFEIKSMQADTNAIEIKIGSPTKKNRVGSEGPNFPEMLRP